MKKSSTIIAITAGLTALALSSCGTNDPEYKAWKEQQASQANNPYGVPQANGESGTYTPSGSAPYQPLPGVNPPPSPQPPLASEASAPPVAAPPSIPVGPTTPHQVSAGDSLWALSKKYNTTVEAIQSANGMTGTNIQVGQTLNIPGKE